eukprot:3775720-Amphidinium_carterae.1
MLEYEGIANINVKDLRIESAAWAACSNVGWEESHTTSQTRLSLWVGTRIPWVPHTLPTAGVLTCGA